MTVWTKNGVVTNFIVIRPEQIPDFESDTVHIFDTDDARVQRGDTWDGERFYREGVALNELEEQV